MRLQFGLVLLLTWAGVAWATPSGLAQQQAQAKQEQAELRKQIKELQKTYKAKSQRAVMPRMPCRRQNPPFQTSMQN